MGRHSILLAIALFLVASSEVLSSATDSYQIKNTNLASGGDTLHLSKRILRGVEAAEEDNKDASLTAEERGFQSAALGKLASLTKKANMPKTAKNLLFRSWLKGGKDPFFALDFYGLKGLAPAVAKKHPNFELWLEYSAIWRAKGGRYMRM